MGAGIRTLIVTLDNSKNVRLNVPDGGRVSLGFVTIPTPEGVKPLHWSDRPYFKAFQIHDKDGNSLCCMQNVSSYRDMTINYAEEVVREEGASIWKSDNNGYEREEKLRRTQTFDEGTTQLPAPRKAKR
jgi:hypothetical protein